MKADADDSNTTYNSHCYLKENPRCSQSPKGELLLFPRVRLTGPLCRNSPRSLPTPAGNLTRELTYLRGGAGTLLHTLRRTSPHALRVPPFPYTHLVLLRTVLVCPRSDRVRKEVLPRNLGVCQRCPLSQPVLQPNREGTTWGAKLTCGNQTL